MVQKPSLIEFRIKISIVNDLQEQRVTSCFRLTTFFRFNRYTYLPYTLARYCMQLNPKLILSACIPYHLSHVNPTLLINPCIYPVSLVRGFKT
ncbi:hypothetical protein BpHYR1_019938 [Brachionus plicatilis]|uniref:Uncharacterized protein n=1 Tax=Brachionus plicatilis TaxID=10195 RepID=A0A3M7T379_BRAPC|nr:hypothetical protein BpHYR1_019938 [Brachionus plicatilis]